MYREEGGPTSQSPTPLSVPAEVCVRREREWNRWMKGGGCKVLSAQTGTGPSAEAGDSPCASPRFSHPGFTSCSPAGEGQCFPWSFQVGSVSFVVPRILVQAAPYLQATGESAPRDSVSSHCYKVPPLQRGAWRLQLAGAPNIQRQGGSSHSRGSQDPRVGEQQCRGPRAGHVLPPPSLHPHIRTPHTPYSLPPFPFPSRGLAGRWETPAVPSIYRKLGGSSCPWLRPTQHPGTPPTLEPLPLPPSGASLSLRKTGPGSAERLLEVMGLFQPARAREPQGLGGHPQPLSPSALRCVPGTQVCSCLARVS